MYKLKPVTLPPSQEELWGRLTKVRSLMEQQDLDYYVSFNPVNIYYLTNFANKVHERPFILVIPKGGTPKMLAPLLEASHVKARARCQVELVTYREFPAPKGENWYDRYCSLIEPSARVGIESTMPIGIAKETPGTPVVTDIINEVRLIKTDYEIGRSIHACQVMNLGHEKILELCRPGVLEDTIYREVSRVMMGKILTDIPGANIAVTKVTGEVWPPTISHDPHNRPALTAVMEEGGPHVSIVGGQVDGYGAELERTFFLGKLPKGAKSPFEAMFEARTLAYELAKPGAIMSEIDRAVRKVIIDRGYGEHLLHRTGHGLGITDHEAPYIAEGYHQELVPGMLISIEPGIYIPGLGGFRHSDTILITDSGCISLTQAPKRLEDLIIPL